jgi:hypothetical protein
MNALIGTVTTREAAISESSLSKKLHFPSSPLLKKKIIIKIK